MPAKVTLTVTKGRLLGQSFEFDSRTTCLMGRASDCQPQLPDDEDHNTISRYHCLLDINPPAARIRDFGSLNGTYINGTKIGQREPHQTPQEAAQINFPEYDLKAGDTIKLGKTVFAVGVEADQEVTPLAFEPPTIDLLDLAQPDALNSINQILAQEDESSGLRNYKLISELGRGGFGAVYLALNQKTGEQVALKVMLPKTKVTQRGINDFLREMHNTQALRHPHVVKLLEYDCFGSTFFFTLEYCEGGSVDKLAQQQGGCLSIDQSISIILQVLDGLDYSHQAPMPEVILPDGSLGIGTGLVHRDLKPANIFLRACLKSFRQAFSP